MTEPRMEYEIKLTIREQRLVLMEVARALQTNLNSIKRRRSWKDSEKAMALYATTKRLVAVNMAIDALTIQAEKAIALEDAPTTNYVPGSLVGVDGTENEYDAG